MKDEDGLNSRQAGNVVLYKVVEEGVGGVSIDHGDTSARR